MPKTITAIPSRESNDEYRQLQYEAGVTISRWMDVEQQAQQTFSIALGSPFQSAHAVFHAAINANARLAMVNEAVTYCLSTHDSGQELLDEWKTIYNAAKKLAKRRNAVAHGQAVVIMDDPNEQGIQHSLGARIVDPIKPMDAASNPRKELAEGISVAQLRNLQQRFHAAAHQMYTHGQQLQAWIRTREESRAL